jgi:ribosome-associated protein
MVTTEPSREAADAGREIAVACTQLALARQARNVKLLYVADRLGIADYFVLATVNNRRQARAVRDAVRVGLKKRGFGVPVKASEDPDGRWSLYDYGGVILHLFDDEGRRYFDLDSLWAGVPLIEVEELPAGALDPEPEPDGDDE